MGELIPNSEVLNERFTPIFDTKEWITCTVGDRTTERFSQLGLIVNLQVVDSIEKRASRPPVALDRDTRVIINSVNLPGTISSDSLQKLSEALEMITLDKRLVRLEVVGEEDLLVLPIAALYPPKTLIFYGQPNKGLVMVKAASAKANALKILNEIGVPSL